MYKKILITLFCFSTLAVHAAALKTDNPVRKPSGQVGVMSEPQSKKITKYSEMLADEKYAEAKSGLTAMVSRSGVSDYVQAVIYQLLGHIDSLQGNYTASAANFKKSIDLDAMPNTTHFGMMLQYAQLLMLGDNHAGGLRALDEYFAVVDEIPSSAFAIKANAHAQLEQFREGKAAIKQAIQLEEKPKESWYQLLLAFHSELTEYREMAEVLNILITMSPDKKTYWMQLSSVYFTLKDDKRSLAVLELAKKKNLLEKETDYMQLFKMYSYNSIPYKAAETLQEALDANKVESNFKNWKQAGAVWYEARELKKALAAYDKASGYATDGDMDLTRSYLYLDLEDWSKAIESITSALQKGGLDDNKTGNAWLMLGMSHASLKNYSQARTAFNNAVKYSKARGNAEQWLNHLTTLERKAAQQTASSGP
ncbi:tetratricopeptide repeat protein [Marinicella sp. S1101]|uniref:tetratricopeptide repeat protein n=1 Tax=Marinicella marina TaxID=2996016 RepID=UPI002260C389|nr:tetratricopeptide repeat protein [Marinicella marina]MCX7552626.1 tetratricopeptide repeat protein [Marinicella marina]MDJ1139502.1 tetratricopeptide repeat protein [Marinicella marina]